jgi:hypothetical protein
MGGRKKVKRVAVAYESHLSISIQPLKQSAEKRLPSIHPEWSKVGLFLAP